MGSVFVNLEQTLDTVIVRQVRGVCTSSRYDWPEGDASVEKTFEHLVQRGILVWEACLCIWNRRLT